MPERRRTRADQMRSDFSFTPNIEGSFWTRFALGTGVVSVLATGVLGYRYLSSIKGNDEDPQGQCIPGFDEPDLHSGDFCPPGGRQVVPRFSPGDGGSGHSSEMLIVTTIVGTIVFLTVAYLLLRGSRPSKGATA